MKKAELIKLLEFVEDDVEILVRDSEKQITYEITGIKPTRTIEMACLVIKEKMKTSTSCQSISI